MDREAHIPDQQFQYIARISHGKDSLKMLDVIFTRGLPLDRITTTDIWATDTIRGEHPKMVEFKDRADEYIWRKYHIEVEHLCAMKNGEKVTYEKLFYHVPKRKEKKDSSQAGRQAGRQAGSILGFPMLRGQWCQSALKRAARYKYTSPGSVRTVSRGSLSVSQERELGANSSKQGGFPPAPPRGAIKIS